MKINKIFARWVGMTHPPINFFWESLDGSMGPWYPSTHWPISWCLDGSMGSWHPSTHHLMGGWVPWPHRPIHPSWKNLWWFDGYHWPIHPSWKNLRWVDAYHGPMHPSWIFRKPEINTHKFFSDRLKKYFLCDIHKISHTKKIESTSKNISCVCNIPRNIAHTKIIICGFRKIFCVCNIFCEISHTRK